MKRMTQMFEKAFFSDDSSLPDWVMQGPSFFHGERRFDHYQFVVESQVVDQEEKYFAACVSLHTVPHPGWLHVAFFLFQNGTSLHYTPEQANNDSHLK